MPKDIHDIINKKLITSFKRYPTTVQDTILRIAGDRLQETYNLTEDFTEIMLQPDRLRPDIVKAKAKQYNFDIREEASLSEQIKLLEAINAIHSKRGSVESIENMWLYYGGNLPKNVKIEIPAQNIFRYNISKFSGQDVFQDNNYYRPGVYNINIEGDYDLKTLRDFINKEFVAAGTKVNYIKRIPSAILDGDESSLSVDTIYSDYILYTRSIVSLNKSGLIWSVQSRPETWSGKANIFVDISKTYELDQVQLNTIIPLDLYQYVAKDTFVVASISTTIKNIIIYYKLSAICTLETMLGSFDQHFYDTEGNEIKTDSKYPGYFILGVTKLGEVINK